MRKWLLLVSWISLGVAVVMLVTAIEATNRGLPGSGRMLLSGIVAVVVSVIMVVLSTAKKEAP